MSLRPTTPIRYIVRHETTYQYSAPVSLGHNVGRLTPRDFPGQSCHRNTIDIQPEPNFTEHWVDAFGNRVTYFVIEGPNQRLSVNVYSEVEINRVAGWDPAKSIPWEQARESWNQISEIDPIEVAPFAFDSRHAIRHSSLADYAKVSFEPNRPLLEGAIDLTKRIHREFSFDNSATNVNTPVLDVLSLKRGVCQDFAHLQISCFRSLGLAARYVSGYLLTDPPPGQPKLVGADASHAWVSLFVPPFGWIDLDPTNNQIPTTRHVTIGWGRDYGDVCPLKGGVLGGGGHSVRVSVEVCPLEKRLQPLKP